jgi:hypothetical protein
MASSQAAKKLRSQEAKSSSAGQGIEAQWSNAVPERWEKSKGEKSS